MFFFFRFYKSAANTKVLFTMLMNGNTQARQGYDFASLIATRSLRNDVRLMICKTNPKKKRSRKINVDNKKLTS